MNIKSVIAQLVSVMLFAVYVHGQENVQVLCARARLYEPVIASAGAIPEVAELNEPYRIEEDALALLCEFEYPGNGPNPADLIYELTSYLEEDEPISIQLVQFAFAKLNYRIGSPITVTNNNRPEEDPVAGGGAISSSNARNMRSAALHAFLRDIASEGNIILLIRAVRITTRRDFQTMDGARKALQHRCRAPGYRRNDAKRGRTTWPYPE